MMEIKELEQYITHRPQRELQAEHAWRLYNSLQEMIRFADYKVYLLYMIAGLVLTVVFRDFKDIISSGMVFKYLFGVLIIAALGLVYFTIHTVMPRIQSHPNVESKQLIYFNDIASKDDDLYISSFLTPPTSEITEDVLLQVTVLSRILKQKFEYLRKAMWAFYAIIGIILLIQFLELFL
jgi:hypothetical protein